MPDTQYAAGTIPWRQVEAGDGSPQVEVLLVYRKRYKDWSFPKGKLDKGESLPQAAVRETFEETGFKVRLGANIGTLNYKLNSGAKKVVAYWAAKVTKSEIAKDRFESNSEIKKIAWLPVSDALEKLTYSRDQDLLRVFADLVAHNKHHTYAVTVLRHAKAEPRSSENPVDNMRPLSDAGFAQASTVIPALLAFGPTQVFASDAKRCRSTVAPLVGRAKLPLTVTASISQDTWEAGELAEMRELISDIVQQKRGVLLCTHLPMIAEVARAIATETSAPHGSYLVSASELPPAGFAIFHLSKNTAQPELVSVESYPIKLRF